MVVFALKIASLHSKSSYVPIHMPRCTLTQNVLIYVAFADTKHNLPLCFCDTQKRNLFESDIQSIHTLLQCAGLTYPDF